MCPKPYIYCVVKIACANSQARNWPGFGRRGPVSSFSPICICSDANQRKPSHSQTSTLCWFLFRPDWGLAIACLSADNTGKWGSCLFTLNSLDNALVHIQRSRLVWTSRQFAKTWRAYFFNVWCFEFYQKRLTRTTKSPQLPLDMYYHEFLSK